MEESGQKQVSWSQPQKVKNSLVQSLTHTHTHQTNHQPSVAEWESMVYLVHWSRLFFFSNNEFDCQDIAIPKGWFDHLGMCEESMSGDLQNIDDWFLWSQWWCAGSHQVGYVAIGAPYPKYAGYSNSNTVIPINSPNLLEWNCFCTLVNII